MAAFERLRGLLAPLVRNEWSAGDRAAKERRLALQDGRGWAMVVGSENWAGKSVSETTALQLATVFACVRTTAQAIASLPLKIYERQPNGRVQLDDHPLADLLDRDPNADQTSLEFWEAMVARQLLNGNAYAHRRLAGRYTTSLTPIAAWPHRRADGDLVYRHLDRGQVAELPREEVFHLKGFGLGGDEGLSAISYGANSLGSALALEETSGRLMGNGLMPSGVLKADQSLDKDQRARLTEIMTAYAGSRNAGKLMILEAGLAYQQLTLNPEDAQLLDQRRFAIEEQCRWFGMPPIIIGHAAQGQTMWGSGVEQILLSWLVLGINPLATRIERRILKQLVPAGDRRRIYAEFVREALLQMDSAAKAAFLGAMTQNGLMSRREGRAKLNLPPTGQPGEEQLTAQTNLAPLAKLGQTVGQT